MNLCSIHTYLFPPSTEGVGEPLGRRTRDGVRMRYERSKGIFISSNQRELSGNFERQELVRIGHFYIQELTLPDN